MNDGIASPVAPMGVLGGGQYPLPMNWQVLPSRNVVIVRYNVTRLKFEQEATCKLNRPHLHDRARNTSGRAAPV